MGLRQPQCVLHVPGAFLEEGVFKLDRIVVGRGCSLGVAAFVHYGVAHRDGVVIHPDSFVMKAMLTQTRSGVATRQRLLRAGAVPVTLSRLGDPSANDCRTPAGRGSFFPP